MSKNMDVLIKEVLQEQFDSIPCPPSEEIWQNIQLEMRRRQRQEVTGKVKYVDYDGYKTPVIIPDKIEKAEKPKNEYVYPFY